MGMRSRALVWTRKMGTQENTKNDLQQYCSIIALRWKTATVHWGVNQNIHLMHKVNIKKMDLRREIERKKALLWRGALLEGSEKDVSRCTSRKNENESTIIDAVYCGKGGKVRFSFQVHSSVKIQVTKHLLSHTTEICRTITYKISCQTW